MTNGTPTFPPTNLEYLDLEQAAVICCVSDERFGKWIAKGIIPVIEFKGKKLIHSHDLIQHLVRHNIPIPGRLLQGSSKKILFILTDETIPHTVTTEVIWALYRLRKRASYVFDFVRFDTNIELKIITFHPDMIVLLQPDTGDQNPKKAIQKLTNGSITVYTFAANQPIDLDAVLSV
jgi:hypothetical protein